MTYWHWKKHNSGYCCCCCCYFHVNRRFALEWVSVMAQKEAALLNHLVDHEANHLLQCRGLKTIGRCSPPMARNYERPSLTNGLQSPYVQAGLQAFYASLHAPPILLLECYCELLCCARRPWSQIAVSSPRRMRPCTVT